MISIDAKRIRSRDEVIAIQGNYGEGSLAEVVFT